MKRLLDPNFYAIIKSRLKGERYMNEIYYQHQTKSNGKGIILIVLFSLLLMIPLALIVSTMAIGFDSWVIDWIAVFGYAIIAGVWLNFLIKKLKVTATHKIKLVFLMIGVLLGYAYIVGYAWAVLNHSQSYSVFELIMHEPMNYIEGFFQGLINPWMTLPFIVDMFKIFISGSDTTIIFALALIVYPILVTLIVTFVPSAYTAPFDFENNQWMKKRRYNIVFQPLSKHTMKAPQLVQALEQGDLSYFKEFVGATVNRRWTEMNLYLDEFGEPNGLIDVYSVQPASRGSVSRQLVIRPINVGKNQLKQLMGDLENRED